MQAAHEVIVRFRRRDELLDRGFGQTSGVGEFREIVAILLKILDIRFGRHPHDDEFPAFIGLADRLDLHAWRRGRQGAVVLEHVGVVGEFSWSADVVTEDVLRTWDAGDFGQVIDERAAVSRFAGPLDIRFGEVVVLRLLRVARLGDPLLSGGPNDG